MISFGNIRTEFKGRP